VEPEAVRVTVKESPWYLCQQSGTVARQIGRSCSPVRHTGSGLNCHRHYFMSAQAIRGGHEADAARVVLAGCIERCCCGRSAVSSPMLARTGRVDPLPIGGHGVS
jgi:hypothetical protein